MNSPPLLVEATRGALVETRHRVAVAVVDGDGRLRAAAGDPDQVTWWRSAAKPFQALPLIQDGVADRLGLNDEELALAASSHSSEPRHLAVVERFMAKASVSESELACGPHPALSAEVAKLVARGAATFTPKWSNCSGKHTGMIALARHHGWATQGYNLASHPVQDRIVAEISRWCGVDRSDIQLSVDGCTAACFGLPLRAMALAYARLGASPDPAARRILGAMMRHPFLVAGTGRLCTDLMTAWPGQVVAKVGADGVYSAALPELGFGVSLKVEDGDAGASTVALLEALRQLLAKYDHGHYRFDALAHHARQPLRNTRGEVTGEVRPAGALRFFDG
jgi:L-asparaginase II